MRLEKMIECMEETYKTQYALSWDNVGLLAGRSEKEITRIYVALDATDEVIANVVNQSVDLLITHHPLIFTPMKQITSQHFIGSRLIQLIQNDTSYYAMHTNYDVLRMSELSAKRLGLTNTEVLMVTDQNEEGEELGVGRIADLQESIDLYDYCKKIKRSFSLEYVKVFESGKKRIKKVAISPGSGSSVIEDAILKGADALVTGDIDHHAGIDAAARGLHIVDAGHYGMEHIFVEDIKEYLKDVFPSVEVLTAPMKHPFVVI